jgi:hypothetical protein
MMLVAVTVPCASVPMTAMNWPTSRWADVVLPELVHKVVLAE